jgi:large subunit ribosomal protein L15
MLINEIRFKLKKKKRIGRGGKKGNYSGRGMKGQKSRAGRKIRPALRDIILKFPQMRGKGFKPLSEKPYIVNLKDINEKFEEGDYIDIEALKKIIKIRKSDKNPKVKILGNGELTKKFIFSSKLLFSNKAKEKIINSGSKIE